MRVLISFIGFQSHVNYFAATHVDPKKSIYACMGNTDRAEKESCARSLVNLVHNIKCRCPWRKTVLFRANNLASASMINGLFEQHIWAIILGLYIGLGVGGNILLSLQRMRTEIDHDEHC